MCLETLYHLGKCTSMPLAQEVTFVYQVVESILVFSFVVVNRYLLIRVDRASNGVRQLMCAGGDDYT